MKEKQYVANTSKSAKDSVIKRCSVHARIWCIMTNGRGRSDVNEQSGSKNCFSPVRLWHRGRQLHLRDEDVYVQLCRFVDVCGGMIVDELCHGFLVDFA